MFKGKDEDKRILYSLLTLLIAASLFLFVFDRLFEQQDKNEKGFAIKINREGRVIYPSVTEEGYCFFIPSGISDDQANIITSTPLYLHNRNLNEEKLSSFLAEENKNSFLYKQNDIDISFFHSKGIPTLYIETLRKDMDYIDSDKKHIVEVSATLSDEDGNDVFCSLIAQIKGRGNNSWDTEKKAYNLRFKNPVDILKMGLADKWVLIPNSTDPSLINNKVVYEFASETGLEWTPETKYINVYFDGYYNGLYLIGEKVEINEERIEPDQSNLLLKRELPMRLDRVNNGFLTEHGNVIEITYPSEVSSYQKAQISKLVQGMEDSIFDLSKDEWKNLIDVDSWVRCYLIDELFDNLDAGIASANFYLKNDGKFYRGPIWDYDSIMIDNPKSMIADTHFRQPYSANDYYYYLNQRDEFRNRVREIFDAEFLPLVEKYSDYKIDDISMAIDNDRSLDAIRWGYTFSLSRVTLMKSYLKEKAQFMQEYWKNRDSYCKVLVQTEIFYRTFVVEKGKKVSDAFNIDMNMFENKEYQYADSDRIFDINDTIEEDIRLNLIQEEENFETEKTFVSQFGILNIVFPVIFLCLLIYIMIKDIKRI